MKQVVRKIIVLGFICYILIVLGLLYYTFAPESKHYWQNVGPAWEKMLKQ